MIGLNDRKMTFYVVQVRTGKEEQYRKQAAIYLTAPEQQLLWPRRNLRIRRQGTWRDSIASIFPGYLFLKADSVMPELYWNLKRIPGFFRFLKSNHNIEPLSPRDREILMHFLSHGEIVDRSKVTFDENRRIRVISGPLRGLEGKIVKVDRRKQRARVKLELYEDSFLIDFGFDVLEQGSGKIGG